MLFRSHAVPSQYNSQHWRAACDSSAILAVAVVVVVVVVAIVAADAFRWSEPAHRAETGGGWENGRFLTYSRP